MRGRLLGVGILTLASVLAIVALVSDRAVAFDQYSVARDATNCRACHGDFRSDSYMSPSDGQNWGNLHNLHRDTMLDGDCDACHLSGGRFPVPIDDSAGGDGFESIGCMGCHGVDPTPGTANEFWGAGLRLHHVNSGVTSCTTSCHQNDPRPPGEDVLPSYYFTPDPNHPNKPTDPCNPSPALPEDFAGLTTGLDNDGDLDYDGEDFDCSGTFADGFESGDTSGWSDTVE